MILRERHSMERVGEDQGHQRSMTTKSLCYFDRPEEFFVRRGVKMLQPGRLSNENVVGWDLNLQK